MEQEAIAVHAEALHNGDVLVTFADATCAVYSAALLRSMLPMADCFVDREFEQVQRAVLPLQSIPSGSFDS
jgi:hypothetical protein